MGKTSEPLASGLYIRGAVMGDYRHTTFSGRHRRPSDSGGFVEVEVLVGEGGSVDRHLFFEIKGHLEVPHDTEGHAEGDDAVLEDRSAIEVVLRRGEECRVRTQPAGNSLMQAGVALAETAQVRTEAGSFLNTSS